MTRNKATSAHSRSFTDGDINFFSSADQRNRYIQTEPERFFNAMTKVVVTNHGGRLEKRSTP